MKEGITACAGKSFLRLLCSFQKQSKLVIKSVQIWLLVPLQKKSEQIFGISEFLILNWADWSNSAKFNTENITAEKIICPVAFLLSDSSQVYYLVKIQSIWKEIRMWISY